MIAGKVFRQSVFTEVRNLLAARLLSKQCGAGGGSPHEGWPSFAWGENEEALRVVTNGMSVLDDFVTETEESLLLNELEPYMKRLRYETSHWDDAIHGYRETEKSSWNDVNKLIIQRIRDQSFTPEDKQLVHVHVLDIKREGYIKPHVDSVRFCGDTIAGLSLMSSSIMRLVNEKDKEKFADILLKRRSLYIMKGEARFEYTHEILPDLESSFKGIHVPRERRISVICRNQPKSTANAV